ncbi:ead/Ea22-like family protein [Enterobacter asburiae]
MSNIDKQALREEFKMMQECYSDPADRERQVTYIAAEALLDELEAAKQDASKWFKAFEKAVSVGARYEEQIAELEAREVVLPQPAQWDISEVLLDKAKVLKAIRDAGITVKGE